MTDEQGELVSREEVLAGAASLGVFQDPRPIRRGMCKFCGLPVQWVRTGNDKAIPMQPGQFPAGPIPEEMRWTFTRDRLHPAPWLGRGERCRLVHMDICPGRPEPDDETMRQLRERLWQRAVRQNGGIPVVEEEARGE